MGLRRTVGRGWLVKNKPELTENPSKTPVTVIDQADRAEWRKNNKNLATNNLPRAPYAEDDQAERASWDLRHRHRTGRFNEIKTTQYVED